MAAPPIFKALKAEDYPEATDNELGQLRDALSRSLTRNENMNAGRRENLPFTSAASGPTVVRVKTDLKFAPKHVVVSGLRKKSGAVITAPWSATSTPVPPVSTDVTFQGLDASTDYFFNVLYE
jgi:hypothetical protein